MKALPLPQRVALLLAGCVALAACNAVWNVDGLVIDETKDDDGGGGSGGDNQGAGASGSAVNSGSGAGGTVNVASSVGVGGSSSSMASSVSSSSSSVASSSVASSSSSGGGAVCGNGIIEGVEECDDGNTNNNDNCDNGCVVDCGFTPNFKSGNTFHCYLPVSTEVSWNQAQADCVAQGAYLVTFQSNGELVSVAAALQAAFDFFWIGASETNNGGYMWSSGEPFVFDAWHPAEPDPNWCGFSTKSSPQWFTAGCNGSNTFRYVCERDPDGS